MVSVAGRSSGCSEKTRKRASCWRRGPLPRHECRGYYERVLELRAAMSSNLHTSDIATRACDTATKSLAVVCPRSGNSPGLQAGVLTAHPSVFSPVYEASRCNCFSTQQSQQHSSIIKLVDPFQPVLRRLPGVMLTLISDVRLHPFQILRPKTNDTLANLPLQYLLSFARFLIDVMRRTTLKLPDPLTDQQSWRNRHSQMHMRFDPTDFVNKRPWRIDDSPSQCSMRNRCDVCRQERRAALGVPDQMKIDFGVVVSRHDRCPHMCRDSSSMSSEKTRKRAFFLMHCEILPRRERRGYYRCVEMLVPRYTSSSRAYAKLMLMYGKASMGACHMSQRCQFDCKPAPYDISPGIHAGVHASFNHASSPVYGASRCHKTLPLAIH